MKDNELPSDFIETIEKIKTKASEHKYSIDYLTYNSDLIFISPS